MKKILVIQTAFIGDVILATGLLESLRKRFSEASIDLAVRKGNEKLFDGHPFLNRLWVWDKRNGKYRDLLRMLRGIRHEKYDLLVNVQRFGASGFLSAFSGARSVFGFASNPFSRFFDYRIAHVLGKKGDASFLHETARNFALIAHLPGTEICRPRLYPTLPHWQKARELCGEGPYITISPASVWFTKQWPRSKWIDLAKALPEYGVLLLGAPGDRELCELIRLAIGDRARVLAGKTDFLTSAAVMKGAAMNFVNDSAPLHLASAVNAPVCAIFCSTIPEFGFGPLSDRSTVVEVKTDLTCRPCGIHGKKSCPKGHFRCAYDIEIKDITDILRLA